MAITVTSGRAGSELLHRGLRCHPQLSVFGEPFCNDARGYNHIKRRIVKDQTGIDLPETGILDATPWSTVEYLQAIDQETDLYKILYHHMITPELTEYVKSQKVIHLVRRNTLAIFVSIAVASRNGKWHFTHDEKAKRDLSPIHVDVKKFSQLCDDHARNIAAWSDRFTVYYSDLIDHWDREHKRIQAYLGVDYVAIAKPLRKIVDRPLETMISNTSELRQHGFGRFLDDHSGENAD